jgi:hypothetical protein
LRSRSQAPLSPAPDRVAIEDLDADGFEPARRCLLQSAGDPAERQSAPHHQNDADDDEQLHQLIAGDGSAQEARPIGLNPLAVLEIRMATRDMDDPRPALPAAPVHGLKRQTQINRSPAALLPMWR